MKRLKIRIESLKRFCELKENQMALACDGVTYYSVTRRGEDLIFEERR